MALARDQVGDRDQRRMLTVAGVATVALRRTRGGGQLGAEVHDARLAGAVRTRELGDAVAVGEHQARGAEATRDRLRAGLVAPGGVQHVPAVHRDDDGAGKARPADRVARRHGVVGVYDLEGERPGERAQGKPERRAPPRLPRPGRNGRGAARRRGRR